jgi:hypothetical protein
MNNTFCKVFNFPTGQLLARKIKADDHSFPILLETYKEGALVHYRIGFETDIDATEAINDLTVEKAEEFFNQLQKVKF